MTLWVDEYEELVEASEIAAVVPLTKSSLTPAIVLA